MQPWVWLTPYLFSFGLLQVLLYRKFRHKDSQAKPVDQRERASRGATVDFTDADVIACQHCGTANEVDRMIRYCRVCTETVAD